jgi:hypothetical protein
MRRSSLSLSRPATPLDSPGNWLRSNDYPPGKAGRGEQAALAFVLLVGADGVPTDCKIPVGFGDEDFKKITCQRLLKRARFAPAINAAGVPIATIYSNTVTWVMP